MSADGLSLFGVPLAETAEPVEADLIALAYAPDQSVLQAKIPDLLRACSELIGMALKSSGEVPAEELTLSESVDQALSSLHLARYHAALQVLLALRQGNPEPDSEALRTATTRGAVLTSLITSAQLWEAAPDGGGIQLWSRDHLEERYSERLGAVLESRPPLRQLQHECTYDIPQAPLSDQGLEPKSARKTRTLRRRLEAVAFRFNTSLSGPRSDTYYELSDLQELIVHLRLHQTRFGSPSRPMKPVADMVAMAGSNIMTAFLHHRKEEREREAETKR
ncbi:hypothetical protein LOC59_11530 [Arthrobacter sp. zg-Y916]|uniref:hypothetical protein n=1 Tax=Arthrobacter sp. zg-Y916 TaxID=2894190 RepID=UPI001E5F1149|nr:hypothetical protein [Arthrobacter sp. zg-Y916]MCC9194267.1 hypothetical protein [Arthrobacter sp. zg-Y916]